MKICRECGVELEEGVNCYNSDYSNSNYICKGCRNQQAEERRGNDPEFYERHLRSCRANSYNKYHAMTPEEKETLLESRKPYKKDYYQKTKSIKKQKKKQRLDDIMKSFSEKWSDEEIEESM